MECWLSTSRARHRLLSGKQPIDHCNLDVRADQLQSVKKPNVRVVKAGITAFDSEGCIDDLGEHHPVDVIICATGYDTSFIPRFPILGHQGINLQNAWAKAPSSYFGIGVAEFPNFMMMLGPYSPVANGPTMSGIGEEVYRTRGSDADTKQKHKPTTSCA